MKAIASLLVLCVLAACTRPSDDAAAQLEILKRRGSPREICNGSRKLADAYLVEKNEAKYYVAKVGADIDCQTADQLES
jgi:hypothetical protein